MSELDPTILAVIAPFPGVRHNIAELAQHSLHNVSELVSNHPTPAFATIIGASAVVGSILEYRALNRDNRNREALVDAWGEVTDTMPPTRTRKLLKSITSLAFVGAGTLGAANAGLWINFQNPEHVSPTLQVVIDKSGSSGVGDSAAANAIGQLTADIDSDLTEFESTAWVASEGGVDQMTLEQSVAVSPFGDAPLAQAFSLSIDNANNRRTELTAVQEIPSVAIAVLTNGNDIKGTLSMKEISDAGSPVYIFDVSEDGQNTAKMKEVASESGGTYFAKDQLDTPEEITAALDSIKEQAQSTEKKNDNNANWLLRGTVLGASALAALKWRANRKLQPTLFSVPTNETLRTKITNNTIGRLPIIGKKVRR